MAFPERRWETVAAASDSRTVNRANWDERVPALAASPGCRLERFIADPHFLGDVVPPELHDGPPPPQPLSSSRASC